ncbi:MAG TPA: MMPL family transporter [Treponemataceae bacterium]|nr:MMPL family transporter [Treponemataceae bacterium]
MERLYRHPRIIIAVILLITAAFASQFPRMELDNNNFRFVPENDPSRIETEAIDEDFGSQVIILIGLERPFDSIFDSDFLGRVHEFDERLHGMDNIDTVSSIVSTDYITSRGDSIVVEQLVPGDFAGSDEEIEAIKQRVRSWDLYDRTLISDDEKSTQVLVSLDLKTEEAGSTESLAVLDDIRVISGEIFTDGTKVYLAGLPVFSSDINSAMKKDLRTLIPPCRDYGFSYPVLLVPQIHRHRSSAFHGSYCNDLVDRRHAPVRRPALGSFNRITGYSGRRGKCIRNTCYYPLSG